MSMCKPFLSLFVKTLKTGCSRRRQISPPVPPSGELDDTRRLWFWPIRSIRPVKRWRYSQNRKYITYCTAARGEPSHGHTSHVQKIRWNLDLCFWHMRANRQTDKHTASGETVIQNHWPQYYFSTSSVFRVCVKNSRRLGLWILWSRNCNMF